VALMKEPDKTFRGKRLDAMMVSELKEMRVWVLDNGHLHGSHAAHMAELAG
jgi:hypothetical protein